MPSIKPISDLRNYTELLKQVTYGNRVYLTRNGKGEFALLTMEELDDIEKRLEQFQLMLNLDQARKRAETEGWHSEAETKETLGVLK